MEAFPIEDWNAQRGVRSAGEALLLDFLKQVHATGRPLLWEEAFDVYPGTFVRAEPDGFSEDDPALEEWYVRCAGSDFRVWQTSEGLLQSLVPNFGTLSVGVSA